MSSQAMSWSWAQTTASSGQRLVLLALADHADDVGICWPSVARLSRLTAISERQVRDHLNALVELGLLQKERRRRQDGSLTVNTYFLAMPNAAQWATAVNEQPLRQEAPPAADRRSDVQSTAGCTGSPPPDKKNSHRTNKEQPAHRRPTAGGCKECQQKQPRHAVWCSQHPHPQPLNDQEQTASVDPRNPDVGALIDRASTLRHKRTV